MRPVRKALARGATSGLFALSLFALLYVVYAHVSSWAARPDVFRRSFDVSDFSPQGLAVLASDGAIVAAPGASGGLDVRGSGELVVRLPELRLGDASRMSLSYHVEDCAACRVSVGVESVETGRRVLFGRDQRRSSEVGLMLEGELSPRGLSRAVARRFPTARARDASARRAAAAEARDGGADGSSDGGLDAGDSGEAEAPDAADGASAQIAVRFVSYMAGMVLEEDGRSVGASPSEWRMGTRVRPIAVVHGDDARVRIDSFRFDARQLDDTLDAFRDGFDGKVLDPKLWSVWRADHGDVDLDVDLAPRRGLSLRAARLAMSESPAACSLRTPSFRLRSFCASARVTVRELSSASVVLGLHGYGVDHWGPRRADVGVVEKGGARSAFAAGHFTGDGQVTSHPLSVPPSSTELGFCYDAGDATIRALVGGRETLRRSFDLHPLDEVDLSVIVNLDAVGAKADVVIHEVRFEPR